MTRGYLLLARGRVLALGLLAVMVVATGFAVPTAHAFTNPPDNPTGALNLTTSPLPISLTAKPGESVSTDIRIRNDGTATEQIKTSVLTFGASGESGTPQLITPTPSDTFINWASFSPSTFSDPPNTWETVHMTIKLPKSAAFGYYYAVVFSRANQATPSGTNQANLSGAIAVLVLLDADVPGAKRSVQVVSFTADHALYEFLPASFTVRLHNDGNVHVAPIGNIFITKGGKNLALLNLNLAGGNILPNTNRVFTTAWSDGYPSYQTKVQDGKVVLDAKDNPESSLTWGTFNLSKIRFGRYTAHMVMAYNDGTRDVPIEATLEFWVVPWRLILFVIAIPVVPSVLVYLIMRRRFRKKLLRAQRGSR